LHAVRTSAGKIVSKIRTDGNSIPHRLTAQHFDHLADDLVQRKRLSFWERLCIERPQTVYDFTGKLPGLDDFVRSLDVAIQIFPSRSWNRRLTASLDKPSRLPK